MNVNEKSLKWLITLYYKIMIRLINNWLKNINNNYDLFFFLKLLVLIFFRGFLLLFPSK